MSAVRMAITIITLALASDTYDLTTESTSYGEDLARSGSKPERAAVCQYSTVMPS